MQVKPSELIYYCHINKECRLQNIRKLAEMSNLSYSTRILRDLAKTRISFHKDYYHNLVHSSQSSDYNHGGHECYLVTI